MTFRDCKGFRPNVAIARMRGTEIRAAKDEGPREAALLS